MKQRDERTVGKDVNARKYCCGMLSSVAAEPLAHVEQLKRAGPFALSRESKPMGHRTGWSEFDLRPRAAMAIRQRTADLVGSNIRDTSRSNTEGLAQPSQKLPFPPSRSHDTALSDHRFLRWDVDQLQWSKNAAYQTISTISEHDVKDTLEWPALQMSQFEGAHHVACAARIHFCARSTVLPDTSANAAHYVPALTAGRQPGPSADPNQRSSMLQKETYPSGPFAIPGLTSDIAISSHF